MSNLIQAVEELQQEVTVLIDAVNFRKSELDQAVAEAKQERKSDFVIDTSYMGKAPQGSSESSPVWTITKIVVAVDGSTTVTIATNVAWTDRLTAIYN